MGVVEQIHRERSVEDGRSIGNRRRIEGKAETLTP
jgi:hypothetical protein